MIPKAILNIAEICAQKDVNQIIISPGSRNAPLTIALARHPSLTTRVISDERSAGYIALGIALETRKPTVLVCTSGTAALNYSPAVAEAFFQQVPLLILTADRPAEWLEQKEGQTIFQNGVYGKHVKKSYQLPTSLNLEIARWQSSRIINEAINLSQSQPYGPVHINVPLREPLYPSSTNNIEFDKNQKIIDLSKSYSTIAPRAWDDVINEWGQYKNKMILVGQSPYDPELSQLLNTFCQEQQIPVVAEVTSNLANLEGAIHQCDLLLHGPKPPRPDLLITFGLSILSKKLKHFLRDNPAKAHWHIAPSSQASDTFQSLTRIIPTTAKYFFQELSGMVKKPPIGGYQSAWGQKQNVAKEVLKQFLAEDRFSELKTVKEVMAKLPGKSNLMLANSMPVRWANMVGATVLNKGVKVFANRGTGGIDGGNSTAVGLALSSKALTLLITGDMAFFYDRNAFWHQYPLNNLRVVLLNNHGGVIFRLIDGPKDQPELENYFETNQKLTAENTALDYNFEYVRCKDAEGLKESLDSFFDAGPRAKILEVVNSKSEAEKMYTELINLIAKVND